MASLAAPSRDVRRMAGKVSGFLGMWRRFFSVYDGRALPGPFTKLLQVLSQVGWSISAPPQVLDHEGLEHDVLRAPAVLLRRRLEHAWLKYVAVAHRHRATMHDLDGIDPGLLRADVNGLSALDTARYAAVRSGAFLFDHVQSKFDLCKTGDCDLCNVPDTAEHRVYVCPRFRAPREPHQWVCARWSSLPTCVTHHLLPPENPHLPSLRRLLHAQPDLSGCFFSPGTGLGWQHLFTDGSCCDTWGADFSLAAWSVIHAQLGCAFACGPVPGILQTAPRAETWALIAAAKWAIKVALPCLVWSDCLNVVDGVGALQSGQSFAAHADADLWDILASLLAQLDPATFLVRHVPSHLDAELTTSPFEDWLACHNGHADTLATFANSNRPQQLMDVYQAALRYHIDMLQVLRALRGI